MQKLNEIIKSLDGRPVASYSKLKGIYERNGITYAITSITGGQYKYALVDIVFDRGAFIDAEVLDNDSQIAACSHILIMLSVSVHMANSEMQQSESNVKRVSLFHIASAQELYQAQLSKYPKGILRSALI